MHFWLDNRSHPAKNTANSGKIVLAAPARRSGIYDSIQSRPIFRMSSPMPQCKHPRVKVVAREEDAEFVECLECGDVFESSEFKDMDIEESKLKEG
jgi:Zn ribbon nucleic-acid-binding protein